VDAARAPGSSAPAVVGAARPAGSSPTVSAGSAAGALPDALPSASARPRPAAAPAAPREAAPKWIERTMTLDLQPTMGIKLSVDGEPPADVVTGGQLTLDAKAHSLTFTCEVCVPQQVAVAAGERDETLRVSVSVKPATLIVRGDVDKTYEIEEEPQLVIRAGANSIALKSMFRPITVRQIETGASRPVRIQAGRGVTVAF
jgi:hypothetical protein